MGTTLGQLVVIIGTPFLTRLYAPGDFGVHAVFAAILSIITVPATLRYENAIHLPKRDRSAAHVCILAILIAIGASLITLVGVGIWAAIDVRVAEQTQLGSFLWLLPLGVLGAGGYASLSNWAIRKNEYRPIAATALTKATAQVGTQVVLGFAGMGAGGLIVGRLVEKIIGIVPLAQVVKRKYSNSFSSPHLRAVPLLAKRYDQFPRYATPATLLHTLSGQLPALLLASFYGPYVAGLYAVTQRVLMTPLTVMGNAVSQVYLGSLPKAVHRSRGYSLFTSTMALMLLISGIPILLLSIFGGSIFSRVLGPEWAEAVGYVRVLGILFVVTSIYKPISRTLDILERQQVVFVGELVQSGLAIVTLSGGAALGWPPTWTLGLYGGSIAACSVVILEYTRRAIRHSA